MRSDLSTMEKTAKEPLSAHVLSAICALTLLVFTAASLPAKTFDISAKHITAAEGLSNNTVRHLYQDSRGFIWMSTRNGLNRYDGRNVRVILPRNDGRPTLPDRRVNSVREDKHGFLWIQTASDKVGCLNLKTEKFVDFTGCGEQDRGYHEVSFLANGTWLWGDNGCLRVTYKDGRFTSERFSKDNGRLTAGKVRRVVAQGQDSWILTSRGLYLWSGGKLTAIDRKHDFMWCSVNGGRAYFVCLDGTVWVFTSRLQRLATIPDINDGSDIPGHITVGSSWYLFTSTGGYMLNMATNSLTKATGGLDMPRAFVTTDNHGNHWLYNKTGLLRRVDGRTGLTKDFRLMPEASILNIDQERYHVVNARNGLVWISTYGNGLYAYNPQDGTLQHFTKTEGQASLVQSNSLLSLMEDRSGNIWAGSWMGGVFQLAIKADKACTTPLQNTLTPLTTQVRMLVNDGSAVWLGTTDGRLFRAGTSLKGLERQPNDGGAIYSIARDKDGTLWVGSRTKGLRIGEKWYHNSNNDPASLSHNSIFAIMRDLKGRMWVGTLGGGLNLAVPDGKGGYTFRRFTMGANETKYVNCMALDRNGWMWVGTSEGLIVFNPERLIRNPKEYHSYSWSNKKLRSNEVRSIMEDRNGRIWIAETGEGFAVCAPKKDYSRLQFKHYGVSDGLVNSMIQAFAEDRQGRVWIATEYGMSCFTPKSGVFRNLFFSSSMAGNTYSENCAATLSDGRLAFGTGEGVAVVNPDLIRNSSSQRHVTFTELEVNGISMRPDDPASPLTTAMPYAKEIKLKHDQNSLVIRFSTLDFLTTTQTLYSYRLEGYDKDWSSPSRLNFAAYKNLSPGTYRLHVRATDADGLWSKNESAINITITPPLWATPFAYIIYIILICGVAWIALRTLRKMNALRTQVKVEEQLADYKLMFFTNISHEFRTPLTLIQTAMERLNRAKSNKAEQATALKLMNKSVNRLLRLINELLEFRKAEKGKLTLQLEEADVIKLLNGYFDSFKETAANKSMAYTFEAKEPFFNMPVDKGKLDKIIFNLLSNAFKYTPAGGTVSMTAAIDRERGLLVVKVSDTGIGIPKARRDKMFTRFASGNASRNSIGIGLHLVHELVSVHKGTISYDENSDGGSVFTVELPADGGLYSADDYLTKESVLLDDGQNSLEDTAKSAASASETAESIIKDGPADTAQEFKPMNDRTILVIEDDDDVRSLLVEELSRYATVVARPDGKTGYEYARSNEVDLILCDVMMPGIDGFEVTRRLKDTFDTSHIPVILLTALSAEDSKLRGVQCGADSYITKPFSTKLLLTRVFKTIELRERLKEKFSNDVTTTRPLISTTEGDKLFVDRLTEVITKNLANPFFTIEDFAEQMSLGRTILYRKVKGVTGYAPKEYLRIMRMKKAAELLLRPGANVSEVAYAVGLNDPFYFSKCFKQQFGVSPSVFRKSGNLKEQPSQAAAKD